MIGYIWAYTSSIIFIGFMIFLCQHVGKRFSKSERFSLNLIYGFVCYTALQGLSGIIWQLLKIDYVYYRIFMIILILILLFYKVDIRKIRINEVFETFKNHLKSHYILYIVATSLIILSLINIPMLWDNNRQDDGWYLLQIQQLPSLDPREAIHASTGFSYTPALMRVVNTYELEASFYVSTFGIPASIFVKVALSFFHYFLLGTCVFELAFRIFDSKKAKRICGFVPLVLFLFTLFPLALRDNNFLIMSDDWQFNSAMGYGSSVVRTMGIFLFLPILDKKLFSMKTIVYIVATSIALISKGSQALPIIYLVVASLVIIWVFDNLKGIWRRFVLVGGFSILFFFPHFGDLFNESARSVYSIFYNNFDNTYILAGLIFAAYASLFLIKRTRKLIPIALPIFLLASLYVGNALLSAGIVFIYGFSINNKFVKKFNFILLISAILILVPGINSLFIDFSVYDFVVKRALTLYAITLILLAFIYFGVYLYEQKISVRNICYGYVCVGIVFSSTYFIYYRRTYSLVHAVAVLKNNMELIPSSTIELSNKLDKLATKRGKDVNVVMPVHYGIDGTPHYPYIMLRLHGTKIRNVSAMSRYGQEAAEKHDPLVAGFTSEEQTVIDKLNLPKSDMEDYSKGLSEILEQFPVIDTFVVANPNFMNLLIEDFGFVLADEVVIADDQVTHYILQKPL